MTSPAIATGASHRTVSVDTIKPILRHGWAGPWSWHSADEASRSWGDPARVCRRGQTGAAGQQGAVQLGAKVDPGRRTQELPRGRFQSICLNMPLNGEYEPGRAPESASRSNCMKRAMA